MMFDTPQWAIKPDPSGKPKIYCKAVDNRLAVIGRRGEDLGDVIIGIPSGLFALLSHLKIDAEVGVVELFIECHKDNCYLGFDQGENTTEYCLWKYRYNQLPKCISHRLRKGEK